MRVVDVRRGGPNVIDVTDRDRRNAPRTTHYFYRPFGCQTVLVSVKAAIR